MQKSLLLFFALTWYAVANAQVSFNDQLEDAKFNIVKRTIEFLSTDSATFKNVTSHTCPSCNSFNDLKIFANDNNLLKAVKNVIEPLSIVKLDSTAAHWSAGLQQFKQQAQDRITSGEKERRKKLAGYNDYVASLDKIVKGVIPDENGVLPVQGSTIVTPPVTGIQSGSQSLKTDQKSAATGFALNAPWIPYALSALLLGLIIYMAIKNSALKAKLSLAEKLYKDTRPELNERNKRIAALADKNEKLSEKLNEAVRVQKISDDKIKSLEVRKVRAVENQPVARREQMGEAKETKAFIQKPKKPLSIIKFAKYADTGDGFSNAELVDKPDNETIFEISTLPDNTGEFRITSNPDAQKYALSNAQYFLGITCQYDSFPFETATIVTETPGVIRLNGGKWLITIPAKISFL